MEKLIKNINTGASHQLPFCKCSGTLGNWHINSNFLRYILELANLNRLVSNKLNCCHLFSYCWCGQQNIFCPKYN